MDGFKKVDIVFSIVAVGGATAACADKGDEAMVQALADYYALVAKTIEPARGRVIKVIGDGMILSFPASQAQEAVNLLRTVQQTGTEHWQRFDSRCSLHVKVGRGPLMSGMLGPDGDRRYDVYGDALNQLFKMPVGDFVLSPELAAVVQ